MPELPEVETIRRSLDDLVGATIHAAMFSAVAPIKHTTARALRQHLRGATIERIRRRGKYLLGDIGNDAVLLLHLGMSGRLQRAAADTPPPPHTHMRLMLAHSIVLQYVDPRRFGAISLATSTASHPLLDALGPEFDDPAWTATRFIRACRQHPRLSLKMALLQQGLIAGLGNIYVCEVLYAARLDPTRSIASTTDAELTRVHTAIRSVLARAIAHGGTSLRDYEDSWGNKGGMQAHLQVYGRAGAATLDGCGQVIRIVQQGRATWYAPGVQR